MLSRLGQAEVNRLFLDANVLFSAAYRKEAGVRRLWYVPDTEIVTSAYDIEDARRNLSNTGQRADLDGLLETVGVSNLLAEVAVHPEIEDCGLPEKDLPILRGALAAGTTHLITGDRHHFGHLYATKVSGVLVTRPADYLAGQDNRGAKTRTRSVLCTDKSSIF